MKSDLAIATLIRSRMTELGRSRGEFAKRLGYKNIAKEIDNLAAAVFTSGQREPVTFLSMHDTFQTRELIDEPSPRNYAAGAKRGADTASRNLCPRPNR